MLQRDAFIEEITRKLKEDKNIYFLSADFGAAALDELREKYPKNFIHCGISEQNMLDLAAGLALEKNKVFVYAMAPFLSLRAIEQTKCGAGLMSLPICIMSVGIGLGYADAGPTHYSTEDFACCRAIVGSSIYTPSDVKTTKFIVNDMLSNPQFSYIRMDRDVLPEEYTKISLEDYKKGFKIYGDINSNKIALISHGKMLHKCLEIFNKEPDKFICIDLFRAKPFPNKLPKIISSVKGIVTVDEQSPSGNLSSCVFEGFSEQNVFLKIVSKSLPEKYIFENGGREFLLNKFGLSKEDILEATKKIT
ncbi:1-deoxy-D-xylulose-5-phosphate synthase [bacterium]|nr:1-deoxy-D-xylulose-5-phosphate synthase [bacterium]